MAPNRFSGPFLFGLERVLAEPSTREHGIAVPYDKDIRNAEFAANTDFVRRFEVRVKWGGMPLKRLEVSLSGLKCF
jgi:hypothetical protein